MPQVHGPRQSVYLVGMRFGRLTVLAHATRKARWLCRCDCGQTCTPNTGGLQTGHARSCGCLQRETVSRGKHALRHGQTETKEYRAWCHMKERCLNPRQKSFANYGGRGITVCDRWLTSFEHFFADVGLAPSPRHTVERLDVNGHYEPHNVEWATQLTQQRNRRSNRILTHNGLSLPVSAWAERTGIHMNTLGKRIRDGWPTDRALTEPVQIETPLIYEGVSLSISAWAERTGIPQPILSGRIHRGWSVERTLTEPYRIRNTHIR